MKAKLSQPQNDKSWALHLFEVSEQYSERCKVISQCLHIGKINNTNPFKQGDFQDWIMFEYWTDNQNDILNCVIETCDCLHVELEV